MKTRRSTILFLTSCPIAWGGSEELWAGAALALRQRGFYIVTGRSEGWPPGRIHGRWQRLKEAGISVNSFHISKFSRAIVDAINRFLPSFSGIAKRLHYQALAIKLRLLSVDLVVVSQGQSFDGCYPITLPEICRLAKVPYVLICQKAAEIHWPDDRIRILLKRSFSEAEEVYFVSEHNRQLVSKQLGLSLSACKVVQNPYLVPHGSPLPWPDLSDGIYHLACVARMWPMEKAQDILLSVLSRKKWRNRPLEVSFFGDGPMAEGLKEMAKYLQLEQVKFPGFANPIDIWTHHHALILPSRAEGLPLAQVEAMLCGRPAIVADAGGTSEILVDGVHGFLASSASELALDDAMERAWVRRDEWPVIGCAASVHVCSLYSADPCADFANRLEAILIKP